MKPHTKEPWTLRRSHNVGDMGPGSRVLPAGDYTRALLCVNALAESEDPVADLTQLVNLAASFVDLWHDNSADGSAEEQAQEKVDYEAARALVTRMRKAVTS